jgi:hypothetical protein
LDAKVKAANDTSVQLKTISNNFDKCLATVKLAADGKKSRSNCYTNLAKLSSNSIHIVFKKHYVKSFLIGAEEFCVAILS